jgi:serine/threonine-protein kinase
MTEDVFGIVGTTQGGVFRVERVVAEGGFAVVYRAQHEGFRAPVALKCLKVPPMMSVEQREQFLDKFREEGELLFRLSALVPAVVRPLHVGVLPREGGAIVPFLALEWLEGEGLDQIVLHRAEQGKPPIEIKKLLAFLQPAAFALAQAHRLPGSDGPIAIIHRDLKPENIFVAQAPGGEVVKILDFGIARAKSAASLNAGHVTQSAALDAFTPGYAAPEQWLPKRYGQVGPWTDVFGLAMTMVEVLIGRPAIDGDLGAMMGTTTDPGRRPTPRTEGAVVSDAVEAAFARALAVDPRERTQSIEAFWTQLEAALGLPPSIAIADAPRSIRSLSMASEPPPPMAPSPPAARPALAAAPPSARPAPVAPRPVAATAMAPSPAAHTIQAPRPAPRQPSFDLAPVPFELATPEPRRQGTLATAQPSRLRDLPSLRGPIQLIVLGLAVSVGDWFYTQQTGEILAVATIRPVWVAGPLVLLGIGMACWRFISML